MIRVKGRRPESRSATCLSFIILRGMIAFIRKVNKEKHDCVFTILVLGRDRSRNFNVTYDILT